MLKRNPISASVIGYWPGVKEIGYGFDLEQAKALMAEVGWTDSDGDGILDKDGESLAFTFKVDLEVPKYATASEVLQGQYKELGVDLDIETYDWSLWSSACAAGECSIALGNITYSEADILYLLWHSSMINTLNFSMLGDPQLDEMLDASRSVTDAEERQEILSEIQRYMVEQAYVVPLYAPTDFRALSNQVKGAVVGKTGGLYLNDAYMVTE